MEKDKGKKVVIGLGLAGLLTGLVYWVTRAKAILPEKYAASVGIELIGPSGEVVEHHSPYDVIEGENYIARLTIGNASTRAGVSCAATLLIGVSGTIPGYPDLLPGPDTLEDFTADEIRIFDYPISIPIGAGGKVGDVTAVVFDAAKTELLASDSEPLIVIAAEIVYGATISIGIT